MTVFELEDIGEDGVGGGGAGEGFDCGGVARGGGGSEGFKEVVFKGGYPAFWTAWWWGVGGVGNVGTAGGSRGRGGGCGGGCGGCFLHCKGALEGVEGCAVRNGFD